MWPSFVITHKHDVGKCALNQSLLRSGLWILWFILRYAYDVVASTPQWVNSQRTFRNNWNVCNSSCPANSVKARNETANALQFAIRDVNETRDFPGINIPICDQIYIIGCHLFLLWCDVLKLWRRTFGLLLDHRRGRQKTWSFFWLLHTRLLSLQRARQRQLPGVHRWMRSMMMFARIRCFDVGRRRFHIGRMFLDVGWWVGPMVLVLVTFVWVGWRGRWLPVLMLTAATVMVIFLTRLFDLIAMTVSGTWLSRRLVWTVTWFRLSRWPMWTTAVRMMFMALGLPAVIVVVTFRWPWPVLGRMRLVMMRRWWWWWMLGDWHSGMMRFWRLQNNKQLSSSESASTQHYTSIPFHNCS